jgi:hypothetical protein
MPKPVQLSYTDDHGQLKKVDSFQQIREDLNVAIGFVKFSAPGVGSGNFINESVDILERSDKDAIFKQFSGLTEKLRNYALQARIYSADDSELMDLKAQICLDSAQQYYFLQCLVVNDQLSIPEKQEMFEVLCDEMKLDIMSIVMLVVLKKQYLTDALQYLGARLANYVCAGFPLTFSFCSGNNLGGAELDEVKNLWAAGADPNAAHPEYGSFLHYLVANELKTLAIAAIDELANKTTAKPYDFSATDGDGKTLLLIAVKTRQVALVRRLLQLHNDQKIDIGLNTPDINGRTPLLLAAALGSLAAYVLLSRSGADKSKIDGKDNNLDYYLKLSRAEVIDILQSIHIEPERDGLTVHNWLTFNDQLGRPVTQALSEDPDKKVLISLAPKHATVLRAAFKEALALNDDLALYKLYVSQTREVLNSAFKGDNDKFKAWLHYGVETAARMSVLDECLAGQALVQEHVAREKSRNNHKLKVKAG